MSRLSIKDLDFIEATSSKKILGSGYMPNTWNWSADFAFDFDSDGIASFAIGNISSFAIAIGPLVISSDSI
jgi:hypothetical protein